MNWISRYFHNKITDKILPLQYLRLEEREGNL